MAKTRAKRMEPYWFLTSRNGTKIYLDHTTELDTIDDRMRFEAGNYFTDQNEADRMIARISGFIKKVNA